jgi:hypothetical protein
MLEVGDEAFDVARFGAAVAAGRACLARGEAAAAVQLLRDGLALWRGGAYAEFAEEEWARPEAQRLGELRLVAYEVLADAELARGRAADIVAELETLAAEHPLRDAFQAKLMLALYRSGRQVEALRAYQAHRQVLADELGLEPPPELAELEGRILVHDEALRDVEPGELRLRGYRLGERLGTGRDGTVYAARSPGVDRDLAIRVVPETLADDPALVRSFDADARRVAALRHPAVVPLYDWWREPGAAHVVMRRLRGGTLRDRLAQGPVPAGELAAVVARVGGALAAAADAGIAHGRVVAESILFDDAGAAYLSDFPLGTGGARLPGEDARDLALLVAEALTGQQPTGATVDDVPAGVAAALSPAEPPPLARLVPALVEALSGRAAERLVERPNPYKGLRAFDEPDAGDFFGRDGLVDEIVDRLTDDGPRGRLVLVAGGSGSGKSSLVRAGLLPRVRGGGVGGSAAWFVAAMVPGASPFQELAECLRRVAVVDSDRLAADLAFDEQGIDRVLRRIVPAGGELLLVVDQLEELFTLAGEVEQRAFLDGLAHAVGVAGSRLRVVRPCAPTSTTGRCASSASEGPSATPPSPSRPCPRPSWRRRSSAPRSGWAAGWSRPWSPSWSAPSSTSRPPCRRCSSPCTSWPSAAPIETSRSPPSGTWAASTPPSPPRRRSCTSRSTTRPASRCGGSWLGWSWSARRASRPGAVPCVRSWWQPQARRPAL